MAVKVAINGFGRIGRAFFKLAYRHDVIDVVVVNDLGDIENLAYLLKYDSAYGGFPYEIKADKNRNVLKVGNKEIFFTSEKDPSNLPWAKMGIDMVIESTGFFTSYEKARSHITAGAKRVVITAPAEGDISGQEGTVLVGINEGELENYEISSNASCTTNAGSPLISILNEKLGIEKALLNTVHAYTASQKLVDSPNESNFREGRSAATNIIPSVTGSAHATTKVIKELDKKFDGIAIRVPVLTGSLVDITFISKRDTTPEEVNNILSEAAKEEKWKGVFTVTNEQVVSSDMVGNLHASIADLSFTKVVGGNLIKVLAWYDNEMGYANTLIRHVVKSASYLKP
jgi:glyceraldehyde 3-phosphate dehydrogenase